MSRYTSRKFTMDWTLTEREDEPDISVEYTMTPVIPADHDQPAEGGEIEIQRVWFMVDGKPVTLTDAEEKALIPFLQENTEFDDQ